MLKETRTATDRTPKIYDNVSSYMQMLPAPEEGSAASSTVLALCDRAYSRVLLGDTAFEDRASFDTFLSILSGFRLAGTVDDRRPALIVHLTAYVLGALNLARSQFESETLTFVRSYDWQVTSLLKDDTYVPNWPQKFSHHSWRVSHWIGGVPSIIRSLWGLVPEICAAKDFPPTEQVLAASDSLIDAKTGTLRTYRSNLVQAAFRALYRIRHDPNAGDVGGIVHLHWVNYAEHRLPYKSGTVLFQRSWELMDAAAPFLEDLPYCLDFDIVQIVRTAATEPLSPEVMARTERYMGDILDFLTTKLSPTYALHKLPGTLATLHECAMIMGLDEVPGLGIQPVDIIKRANWI